MSLFPQLPHHVATELAESACSASIQSLSLKAATQHPSCEYTPIGGVRVTTPALQMLRGDLLKLAIVEGYPNSPNQQQAARFDAEAAVVLAQQMPIAPAEAVKGGIWEFISCVLLPDVTRWRFGGITGATPIERFVSGRRNVYQRLWWRAYHLRPRTNQSPHLLQILRSLGEDELVQLMERPSLAGVEGLPSAIATGLLEASRKYPSLTRRQLIREAQKRLLRLSSFLSLESIAPEDVLIHVDAIFDQVASSLICEGPAEAAASSHG